ncbi:MAG: hypothetical protein JWP89_3655 [Schlesneria sp.]|nr:hypothetical protein [Schlesneria sp.]
MRMRLFVVIILAGGLCGCSSGEKPIKTASLTGEVKRMSGEPVGKVKVVFHPKTGPTAVATTDDAGKFTATVPLGECRVAVVSGGEAKSADMSPEATAKAAVGDARVEPQFASPESSGLTVKVEPKQAEKVVFIVK